MRVVCWNCRRASENSTAWDYLLGLDPDLVLLQEVSSISERVLARYEHAFRRARGKTGAEQRFGTALLVRGRIVREWQVRSDKPWVNSELEHFSGNALSYEVECAGRSVHVMSVYNPAWQLDRARLESIEPGDVRLPQQAWKLWVADLLWDALRASPTPADANVIVGGDFNLSETFDILWGDGPRGNAEYLQRMKSLGLSDCLRHAQGALVPTFRNASNKKILHQMDHLFASAGLLARMRSCDVGRHADVFDTSLSDHLPIVAEFGAPI